MDLCIDGRVVGDGHPVLIIGELSANHLQDFDTAVESIKVMKECGVDAVKLQTYSPDTLTIDCEGDYFKIVGESLWDGSTYYNLYKDAFMPWDWQPKLKKIAEDLGLILFSSPFDKTSVDYLEDMDVGAYKIASFEITDIPLIEYVAATGKPVILSTGIASLCDMESAVGACKRMGNDQIALLKCTSSYPASFEEMNLKVIPHLKDTFNTPVGLSDHTLGTAVPVASVALGACIIEKHFILNRNLGGPDADFSIEPCEFKLMVESVRNVEKALGKVTYELTEKIKRNRIFSRSLFVVEDVKMGELFTENNVKSIRPGYGLHPKYIKIIIGRTAKQDISRGTPLSWDVLL
jgi:pseudaminic acid synthase